MTVLPRGRSGAWLSAALLLGMVAGFILAPWPLLDKLWAVGYGICPQRVSHSYFLGGQQLPVEARMAGMFAGFLLSMLTFVVTGRFRAARMPSLAVLLMLVLFAASMAVDGLNNTLYDLGLPALYAPYNPARLVTGLLMGAAMAGLLWPIWNMTVWQKPRAVSVLDRPWQVVLLLLALAAFAVSILAGADWLLYPVSLLITAGQLGLLVTIGAVLAAPLLGRLHQARRSVDLLPLVLAGLTFGAVLLAALSALRYAALGATLLP